MSRDRFFSCANEEVDNITNKKDERIKSPMAKRPIFKTLVKNIYKNTSKGEGSMIKARHNYGKVDKILEKMIQSNENKKERSPNAKKRKRDDERAEADESEYEEIDDDEDIWTLDATIALKELETGTEKREIAELIKCFEVENLKNYNHFKTRQNIKELMRTWSNEELVLRSAIKYLDNEENTEIKTYGVEDLISCLILSTKNRMPRYCEECKDLYRTEMDQKPKLRCIICNVGTHNCENMQNNTPVSGIFWVCSECSMCKEKVYDNLRSTLIKDITKNSTNEYKMDYGNVEADKRNGKVTYKRNGKNTKDKNCQDEMNKIVVVLDTLDVHEPSNAANVQKQTQKHEPPNTANVQKQIQKQTQKQNEQPEERPRTCIFWVRGMCRNTDQQCQYAHPQLCVEIIETGECTAQNCALYHPKMCNNSKQYGQCIRGTKCYFTHIRQKDHRRNSNIQKTARTNQSGFINKGNYPNHNSHHQKTNKHHNAQNNRNASDFLSTPTLNWEMMKTPLLERAAEILADRMLKENHPY